jgi:hypothetical protein
MTLGRLFRLLVRLLPILVLGLLARQTMAQADPPGRVARLNLAHGSVVFSPAGDNEWTDAVANRPLTRGDRVWTDRGSRAEIQVGSSAVRLDGQTHLEILALDDQTAQLSVTQGTVYVRVRTLPEGENFEIDTPNIAYRAAYPGDYRIDVAAAYGTTRVTIHSGTGAVYGENGEALPLGGGQQITFKGRSLAQLSAKEAPPQDAFDRWAAERNRQEDQTISARFVPREVVGYQQLDAHGKWAHDLTHGMVWFPQGTAANWAPYRHGYWEWISPWGWTWIDDAPWGFAPSHYGRWALIESRWAWVPGRLGLRPVYAPALVAFIGGGSGNWDLSTGGGRPGVAWFPLAPGEAWQPAYRASPVYISNVNRNIAVQSNASYAHQRSAEALTAISAEDFHRGKPVRAGWLRLAANFLTNAQIVPPPPMPENSGTLAQQRATPARVSPPPAAEIRQVIATATPASAAQPPAPSRREREAAKREAARREAQEQALAKAAQAEAQRLADADRLRQAAQQEDARREGARDVKRDEAAAAHASVDSHGPRAETAKPEQPPAAAEETPAPQQRAEQARVKEQAQRAAQARAKEQSQRVEQARAKEQAQRVEQARAKEQPKREQAAARAEHTKREQAPARAEQARREQASAAQARREQVASQAEQAKRAQASRRAEQAKQQQLALRESTRREQLVRREEQARRETLAKREAQVRRGEQLRREAHAQRLEQARRAADREAQALRVQRQEQARAAAEHEAQALREQRAEREAQAMRDQRARREEQARREAEERQQAQREAWERQQQAIAEQSRREHQQWEQQQQPREQARRRPELRPDPRDDRRPGAAPEVWQRGIPILNPGRTS